MAIKKFTVPKGTRDFLPLETWRRNYIFSVLRETFSLFGYQPIETPAMENLSTLLGKYGDEGDKLIFKILNSGDFLAGLGQDATQSTSGLLPHISEKGLRYDLTVPFARFVVQHRDALHFPFKRYQIQPVWRADRPQKGRYREFYQCDVDVIGSTSLLNEVELIRIIHQAFDQLKIRVKILVNNRKILAGMAEIMNLSDRLTDITVAIDKLDKIGLEKVNEELLQKGINPEAIEQLQPILNLRGSFDEKLGRMEEILHNSEQGLYGCREMKEISDYLNQISPDLPIEFDLSLARGLHYYTGTIFEVKALDVQMGSICGGGRYDNLTGIFGLADVSGVGISFGADRIYDVMQELNVFPGEQQESSRLLIVNFGPHEIPYALRLLQYFQSHGIAAELYPDSVKIGKQFAYADQKNIPFVVMAGSNEIENQVVTLKNLKSGDQITLSQEACLNMINP